MSKKVQKNNNDLFLAVRHIIESARAKSYQAVNKYLLESYWQIGKLIVEEEQKVQEKCNCFWDIANGKILKK